MPSSSLVHAHLVHIPPRAEDRRGKTCNCEHCPECGPILAAERARRHARALERARATVYVERGADELGSVWGVEGAPERAPKPRMSRPLTPEQWQSAFDLIEATPCRREIDRDEWERLVWEELLEPSVLIYGKETRLRIETKVTKAISRAQARLRAGLPRVRFVAEDGRPSHVAIPPVDMAETAPIKIGDTVRLRKREGRPLRDLLPRFRVVSVKRKYAEIEDTETKESRKIEIGELERC